MSAVTDLHPSMLERIRHDLISRAVRIDRNYSSAGTLCYLFAFVGRHSS